MRRNEDNPGSRLIDDYRIRKQACWLPNTRVSSKISRAQTKPEMKGDAACAQKCIRGGSPAVLVTEAGKIYKIFQS